MHTIASGFPYPCNPQYFKKIDFVPISSMRLVLKCTCVMICVGLADSLRARDMWAAQTKMAQGQLIIASIFNDPSSASVRILSAGAPWPLPLSLTMNQTFISIPDTCHVLNVSRGGRKPDEWWINSSWAKYRPALCRRCRRWAGRALPTSPSALPGTRQHFSTAIADGLAHLRRQEAESRTADGASYFSRPRRALCPCHMSLTLVLMFDNTSRQAPFSFAWDTKGTGRG